MPPFIPPRSATDPSMSSKQHSSSFPRTPAIPYTALPPSPQSNTVVVLVPHPHLLRYRRRLRRCLLLSASFLLLSLSIYVLFPSDPTLELVRLRLNNVRVNSSPSVTLDLSFSLTIRVRNRDIYALYLKSLDVSVGYRGRELGLVSSEGGKIRARGSSYVNATLELNGLEVVHDVFYLIEDVAKGVVPFDADTKVNGDLGILVLSLPIKGRVSCEVDVSVRNQSIVHRNCSPK